MMLCHRTIFVCLLYINAKHLAHGHSLNLKRISQISKPILGTYLNPFLMVIQNM